MIIQGILIFKKTNIFGIQLIFNEPLSIIETIVDIYFNSVIIFSTISFIIYPFYYKMYFEKPYFLFYLNFFIEY